MLVFGFVIGVTLGFGVIVFMTRSKKEMAYSVSGGPLPQELGGDVSISDKLGRADTARDTAVACSKIGQVAWVSGTPLSYERIHNIPAGVTVNEALSVIKHLEKLSYTTVVIDGLDGLEPAGLSESPTSVVDELKASSPCPVHLFLPDVN